jgi:hypothetical protein
MREITKDRLRSVGATTAPELEEVTPEGRNRIPDAVVEALVAYAKSIDVFYRGEEKRDASPPYILLPDRPHPSEVERDEQKASYAAANRRLRDAIRRSLGHSIDSDQRKVDA